MPVFAKNMLLGACVIAETEKDDRALGVVVLEADGTIVARNRSAIYVAQPANQALAAKLKLTDAGAGNGWPVAVRVDVLTKIVKGVPVDKQFKGILEHINISGPANALRYQHTMGGGEIRGEQPSAQAFGTWRANLAEFIGTSSGSFGFNRKRLTAVIEAIEAACKYDGEFAYIYQKPVEKGLIWLAENELYGTAVFVAFVAPKQAEKTGQNRLLEGWAGSFLRGSKQAPDRPKPRILLTRRK